MPPELFAVSRDLQSMRFHRKTQALADFVLELFNFIALKFDDLFTILADNVIVMRVLGVIGVVEFVILAKVHFPNQAALGQ